MKKLLKELWKIFCLKKEEIKLKKLVFIFLCIFALFSFYAHAFEEVRLFYKDKTTGDWIAVRGENGVLFSNNGSGVVSGDTIYAISLSDSTTFIRGGIPGDATAITECSIDKVDPISKNIVWKEEYDFVYDVNNNLIGIHLKK